MSRALMRSAIYVEQVQQLYVFMQQSHSNEQIKYIEALSVSPENRSQREVINKKWVIIDLMIGFWEISNTPHHPTCPSPPLLLNRYLQEFYI
ncbi:MAG: hypothetical protein AAGJ08_16290 [Cyanobacteria bacterium P01_H01_bin.35]